MRYQQILEQIAIANSMNIFPDAYIAERMVTCLMECKKKKIVKNNKKI